MKKKREIFTDLNEGRHRKTRYMVHFENHKTIKPMQLYLQFFVCVFLQSRMRSNCCIQIEIYLAKFPIKAYAFAEHEPCEFMKRLEKWVNIYSKHG